MLKNFINRVKNLVEQNKDNKLSVNEETNDKSLEKEELGKEEEVIKEKEIINDELENLGQTKYNEEIETEIEIDVENTIECEVALDKEDENENEEINKNIELINNTNNSENKEIKEDKIKKSIKSEEKDELSEEIELTAGDIEYIKEIKIKRGKSIKARDVYTNKVQIFKTHKECSKKLNIPIEYIQENLKYGYTDYLGQAIKYLSKELGIEEEYKNYLDSNKLPAQILSNLNNKIFKSKLSQDKIDEILCSDKIEPVKMHYIFECIDEEYDDYFKKYGSIIKRGGKKRIDLIDKKGEVIERFKSLDECAKFLGKDKDKVVDMLKHNNTKAGKYEIKYSLRSI